MDVRSETAKRLQVAAIGLALVLMAGGVARLTIEAASNETPVLEELAGEAGMPSSLEDVPVQEPDEPLAELGVTPAVEKPANTDEKANPPMVDLGVTPPIDENGNGPSLDRPLAP